MTNSTFAQRAVKKIVGGAATRRGALAATGLLASLAFGAFADRPASAATSYPNHPVTIVIPFAAGGSADVYARLLAPLLQKELGQPFVVEDRPGAGSLIGTESVKVSRPDGYTLLLISNTHTVNETLYAHKPFKLMRDFAPISPINSAALVLVTKPTLAAKTVGDIIKMAKAKPGALTFASSGYGTPYHMAGELFKQMAGINMLHVPYKGSNGARMDVIGGHVDMMFDAVTTMAPLIKSGKVTGIATTGATRSKTLPELPTVAETVPGYQAVIWLGLVAPKGTPAAVVDKLNAALTKILKRPDVQASWEKQGATPVTMSPARFTSFLKGDIKKWAKVVKVSGAKVGQ